MTPACRALRVLAGSVMLSSVIHAEDGTPPPLPPPGRLVDIGGWRLHLHCTGEAKPGQATVVLEAGLGDFSVEWSLVQPKVTGFARVCSYDRAGHGWSELGPYPRTMRQIDYELHALLNKADIRPPYVLVGQSFGAWLVRMFASMYPAEVAGMVLVDGGFDNPWRLLADGKLIRAAELNRNRPVPAPKTSAPLRIGDIPPGAMAQMKAAAGTAGATANEPPRDKLPADAQRMRTWGVSQWQHYAAAVNPFEYEELAALRTERLSGEAILGDVLLVVLTRGIPDGGTDERERTSELAELAKMSRNGNHVIARRSGHHIHIDEPDLVVEAIRGVTRSGAVRK